MTRSPERDVVPQVLDRRDRAAGDEALFQPEGRSNAALFGGPTDEAAWARAERAFYDIYRDIAGGRAPYGDPRLEAACVALGVPTHLTHDRRPLRVAPCALPDRVLAEATEDAAPDALMFVERVVGEAGDPGIGALAALAFVGCARDGRRPVDFWSEDERERDLVRAMRVVEEAPVCVYADGEPLLPLAERSTPPPEAAPRGVWVGRAYRLAEGWAWSGLIRLPRAPERRVLERRVQLELLFVRRRERRSTWEDMLRRRAEVVYRAAHEGARRVLEGEL